MEFLSKGTCLRLISKQVNDRQKAYEDFRTDQQAEYDARRAAGQVPYLSKFTGAAKRRLIDDCKAVYGNSLLSASWSGRTFVAVVYQAMPKDDVMYSDCVAIRVYTVNARSNAKGCHTIAMVTQHALQRLLQRKEGMFNAIDALKEELPIPYFDGLLEWVTQLTPESFGEYKLETATGLACCVVEEHKPPTITTWYPK